LLLTSIHHFKDHLNDEDHLMFLTPWLRSISQRLRSRKRRLKGNRYAQRQAWNTSDVGKVTELLEDRTLLSAVSEAVATLNIDIDSASENVAISSNGTTYALVSSGTFTGTDTGNVTGTGTNTLTVTAAGLANFNLINVTDSSTAASFTFNDSAADTYGDSISVTLDDATAGTITFNGASSFTGTAALSVSTARNITAATTTIQSIDGAITLVANQGATQAAGNFDGILLTNSTIQTGGGVISLTGRGGDAATGNSDGIFVDSSTIRSTGSGTITLDGTATDGETSDGVDIDADATPGTPSLVTSLTGAITITGTSAVQCGVEIQDGSSVSSTGTGASAATITLLGTADEYGVYIGESGTSVSSVDGDISVTGVVQNVGLATAVWIEKGADITSTGTGAAAANITLNGTSQRWGTYIEDAGTLITSVDGDISITGNGVSENGVTVTDGAQLSNELGDISILGTSTGDKGVHLSAAGTSVTSTGTGASAGNISLTGTGSTGVSLDAPVNSADGTVTVQSGGGDINITENGDITSTTGTVTLDADTAGTTANVVMANGAVIDAGSAPIDIDADADITLSALTTTNATSTAVTVTSVAGGVIDGGDTNIDITANSGTVVIDAATGVGDAGAIDTTVASADISTSAAGDIDIDETDAIVLSDVDANDGSITVDAGGQITARR
jgi:hypothetical protein